MEHFTLNNGVRIPAVGLGTYSPEGSDFSEILKSALDAGYRLFDTASLYGTEKQVGKALAESGLPREEYQVQSKLWIDEMGYKNALEAFSRSMDRLRLDYLDIYFIHWPRQYEAFGDASGAAKQDWKELLRETYAALEELYDKKLIRGIGVSNFLPHHLVPVLEECRVRPVADQMELHIGFDRPTAVRYAQEHGIRCEAWSPLARGRFMNDGFVRGTAEKYGVSVAQLALRYLNQLGILSVPKASSAARLKENLDIFSFCISEEDMSLLACMTPAYFSTGHPDFQIPRFVSPKD